MPRQQVIYAFIGSSGAMDAEVVRAEPLTWDNDVLAQYLSPEQIGELLGAIDALPEKKVGKPARKGIDLDEVLWTLLEHHSRAVVRHEDVRQVRLRRTRTPGGRVCVHAPLGHGP